MNSSPGATMPFTDDLDQICSYLTQVRGLQGAGIFDEDGLEWGVGTDCHPSFADQAPWAVGQLQENESFAQRCERPAPDFLLIQDPEEFLYCRKFLERYYYVVSGSRGSFELFTGRIDRCIQMAETALKERRTAIP